jgi:hypothetical protein
MLQREGKLYLFLPILRSHSRSFRGAQGVPKFKIGLGRGRMEGCGTWALSFVISICPQLISRPAWFCDSLKTAHPPPGVMSVLSSGPWRLSTVVPMATPNTASSDGCFARLRLWANITRAYLEYLSSVPATLPPQLELFMKDFVTLAYSFKDSDLFAAFGQQVASIVEGRTTSAGVLLFLTIYNS